MFWVYMLRCADDSFYTGHTDCMEQRLGQHQAGTIASCYTFNRRPVELVYQQEFGSREEALAAERQMKGWSRAKKQALIRQDWPEISRLAVVAEKREQAMISIGRGRSSPVVHIVVVGYQSISKPVHPFALSLSKGNGVAHGGGCSQC